MTVNDMITGIGHGIMKGGKVILTAIGNATIGDLLKVGVLVGSAVVTVALAVKKLKDRHTLYKNAEKTEKEAKAKAPAAAADVARAPEYADVRKDLRDASKKKYDDKLRKKSKSWKRLTKKEREEMKRLEHFVDLMASDDPLDREEAYFSLESTREKLTRDYRDPKRAQAKIDEANLFEAYKEAHPELYDDQTLVRLWHSGGRLGY